MPTQEMMMEPPCAASVIEAANNYLSFGLSPTPLTPNTKTPYTTNWTSLRLTPDQITTQFNADDNIGILTGVDNVISVDCDWLESGELAQYLLPSSWMFGRGGHVRHILLKSDVKTTAFDAPLSFGKEHRRIIEILSKGKQVMSPPSWHPNGEQVIWINAPDSKPIAEVSSGDLLKRVGAIAGCALLTRLWEDLEGTRQDTCLALSGALFHAGWPRQHIEKMLGSLLTVVKDEEKRQRAKAISSTLTKAESGDAVTGLPALSNILDDDVVTCLVKWWHLGNSTLELTFGGTSVVFDDEDNATTDWTITEQTLNLISANDIKPEPVKWLWNQWLAEGKLEILAGTPGTGKTTLTLAMAAIISKGGIWPDGDKADKGNVIIWSGEDDANDTVIPRLMANGADLNNIHIVGNVENGTEHKPFDPATDLPLLLDALTAIENIKLIIVDPVISLVSGDSHKNSETRRALQPLVTLASKIGACVLGISHLTKGSAGKDPVERISGSLAFGALARVVLIAARSADTESTDQRILARAKSNVGIDQGGFAYDVEITTLPHHAAIEAMKIKWLQPLPGSARELLAIAEQVPDDEPVNEAEQHEVVVWLKQVLADGPLDSKKVEQLAKECGYSRSRLHRYRKQAGVEANVEGFGKDKHCEWSLPTEDSNNETSTTS